MDPAQASDPAQQPQPQQDPDQPQPHQDPQQPQPQQDPPVQSDPPQPQPPAPVPQPDPPQPVPEASGGNVVQLQAAVGRETNRAAEIVELCCLAGMPELAHQMITSNTPVAQARRQLVAAKAAQSDGLVTIPPHQAVAAARQPVGPNHHDVWAARTYSPTQRI